MYTAFYLFLLCIIICQPAKYIFYEKHCYVQSASLFLHLFAHFIVCKQICGRVMRMTQLQPQSIHAHIHVYLNIFVTKETCLLFSF